MLSFGLPVFLVLLANLLPKTRAYEAGCICADAWKRSVDASITYPSVPVAKNDIKACALHCKQTQNCNSAWMFADKDTETTSSCVTGQVTWLLDAAGKQVLYLRNPSQPGWLTFMDGSCEDPRNAVLAGQRCYTDNLAGAWTPTLSTIVAKRRLPVEAAPATA